MLLIIPIYANFKEINCFLTQRVREPWQQFILDPYY